MTSSSFHRDSSRHDGAERIERSLIGRRIVSISLALALTASIGTEELASAQTSPPAVPSQQQPGQPQAPEAQPSVPAPPPSQPGQPSPAEQLLQQYPLQQPIGPPLSPAVPPSTTLPPWTPPTPPAPSQTNVPAPFPGLGGPGTVPPGYVGVPGLTIPGAFAPTVTTVRGATLEFHPTLRLSEEYSDNFFQASSRAEDNFRSIFGPGFNVLLNGARTFGALTTTVDLVHDTARDSGDDPKVFPSLYATVRYAVTPRLALTVTDTFIRTDSASTLDRSGIRRGRQTSNSNNASIVVDWLLDQVATQAYYRNVLFFNEDDGRNTAENDTGRRQRDTITHILGANAATRIGTDYTVRGGYEFSRTDGSGESRNDVSGDTTSHTVFAAVSRQFGLYTTGGVQSSYSLQTQEDTRVWNASLFGAYGLPTGLSVAGSAGYSLLSSDSRDNEGIISASLNASYRFTRAIIAVGVLQDFRQTAQQGENFGTVETRTYFGSFLYQLTPFINTALNVSYSENSPTGTGNTDNNRTQKTLTYGASLNWQILRWLTSSLQYTYTKSTGNNTFDQGFEGQTGDYAENRISLSLFATF